jgi:hypothetical protein
LVTDANGDGANFVLVLQIFREMGGHHNSAHTAGSGEVSFS